MGKPLDTANKTYTMQWNRPKTLSRVRRFLNYIQRSTGIFFFFLFFIKRQLITIVL